MITIEQASWDLMIADAIQAFPDECCGFLLGTEHGENRLTTNILVVDNAKEGDKRRRFEISPKDYLKAERYAVEKDLSLLSVYHSHPNHPAIPSEQDRVAAQPYFSYVIVSVLENGATEVRSWRLNEAQQFEEEQVTT